MRRPEAPVHALALKGAANAGGLEVYLHAEAVRDLVAALPGGAREERGGLLAGEEGRDERGAFVVLRRALAAEGGQGARLSFTFTPEAWEGLWAAQERECPECRIVGWYHTHPGLGVFLSEQDLFIHRHFFRESFHVAVVVDPEDFTWGVFHWEGEGLRSARGLYLYAEAEGDLGALVSTLREKAAAWIIPPELAQEGEWD